MWPFKPKPSNGWQRLAHGANIPARPGQKFDVRLDDGDELYGLVCGVPWRGKSASGKIGRYLAKGLPVSNVTHYRIHKPVSDAAREARSAEFDRWREIAEGLVTDPVRLPEWEER